MVKGYKSLLETKDWQQKSGALSIILTWVVWAGGGGEDILQLQNLWASWWQESVGATVIKERSQCFKETHDAFPFWNIYTA